MANEVKWTEEQKQAIYEKDSNILVAAAAGSGKTAVLVERILKKITIAKRICTLYLWDDETLQDLRNRGCTCHKNDATPQPDEVIEVVAGKVENQ